MWNICINMSRSNYSFFLFYDWHLIILGRKKKASVLDAIVLHYELVNNQFVWIAFIFLRKNLYPLIVWHNILHMTIGVVHLPSYVHPLALMTCYSFCGLSCIFQYPVFIKTMSPITWMSSNDLWLPLAHSFSSSC